MQKRRLGKYTVENILGSLYRRRGPPPVKTADEITADIFGFSTNVDKVHIMSSAIHYLRRTGRVKKVGEEENYRKGRPRFLYQITKNGMKFYEYKFLD